MAEAGGAGVATIGGATLTVALGTASAIIVGLLKSIVVAQYFGIGVDLDVFYIAMMLPTIFSNLIAGTMQSSIIPVYIEHVTKNGRDAATLTFNSFFGFAVIVFLVLGSVLLAFPGTIISLLAPGFDEKKIALSSELLQIMAAAVVFGGVADLLGGLLNANRKFLVPAFGSALNVVVSLICLFIFKDQGIYALATGFVAGAIVQCIYTSVGSWHSGFHPRIVFRFRDPGLRRAFTIMTPMLLGSTFSHINITIDQMMASTLPEGSIAALNYANNINSMIAQLFIFSLSAAILPFLSQQFSEGKLDEFNRTFSAAIRTALFFLVPATVFIIVFGTPLIRVFLQRGMFSDSATHAVADAWKAFSLGLTLMAVGVIIVRVITSLQLTRLIAYVAFVNVFINVSLNLVLMRYLFHVGIALSTSITYCFSTLLLMYLLKKHKREIRLVNVGIPVLRICGLTAVAGAVTYGVYASLKTTNIVTFLIIFFLFSLLYIVLGWIARLDELKIILGERIPRKFMIGG